MMIREFTVIKPKMKKVLVADSKLKDGDQFKDIPINISDILFFKQIKSEIKILSSSWTGNNEIKITTDATDEQIKQCMKKLKLKITTHRDDLKGSHSDKDGKTIQNNNAEFVLTDIEKLEISDFIDDEEKKEALIPIIQNLDQTLPTNMLKDMSLAEILQLKTELRDSINP